ncbi:DUF4153 domain-containing protein [Campylobacter sp. JMF_14 EL1]|nr:DUF4153 domain-containing protein [Campylobacter sp. JMF_14 EL1]
MIFIDFYKSKEIADIIYFCLILISTSAVFENLKIPQNRLFRIVLIFGVAICLFIITNTISNTASGYFAEFGEYKFILNLSVILILVALFALPIKLNITISAFVESLIVGVILTIVCLAFWITLNSLFRIRDEIFPASFVLAFAFCFVLLLGKIALNSVFEENKIFKAIYFLAFIYCVILWIYLLFRALNLVYPKISIVHLIIWFSAFWLILFWLKEQKTKFDKFFAFCILGLLCVSFYAILVRINQYGITPNRYFVVAFGGWIFLALCFSLANLKHKFMLILFACILAFSVFSPLNFLKTSINSQLKIYENITPESKNLEKLKNIEGFFRQYGVKIEPKSALLQGKDFSIDIKENEDKINEISGFTHHITSRNFKSKIFSQNGLDFNLTHKSVRVSDKNKSVFELDFGEYIAKNHNINKNCKKEFCRFEIDLGEISFENDKLKCKIVPYKGDISNHFSTMGAKSSFVDIKYDFYFSVKK